MAEQRMGDIHAAAKLLGCSPAHVRRLRDEGQLPGVTRFKRLVRYDLIMIHRWIDAGCPARAQQELERLGVRVAYKRPKEVHCG